MSVDAFLDTNILLYAISTAEREQDKRQRARDILRGDNWGLSIQVLQEFYVNVTRPPTPAMQHDDAVAAIEQFMRRPLAIIDNELMRNALRIKARFQLTYWDSAIVAAAHRLGADSLYSEDLNDGQDYGGVTVVNPFNKR